MRLEVAPGCAASAVSPGSKGLPLKVSFHTYPRFWPFPVSWKRWSKLSYKYEMGHALRQGMKRHGVTTSRARKYEPTGESDIAVVWSWKQPRLIESMIASGRHVIVMERGFLPRRKDWCSLALDGFNGRGRFAPAPDGGARWNRHFAHLLKPWRSGGDYALMIGKGPNDPSLHGADFEAWTRRTTDSLVARGQRVRYRPHPDRPTPCPPGAELSTGTLAEDLADAAMIVSFNSSTDVEAILSGIPGIITDAGSLCYPIAAHDVSEPLVRPDRTQWCHDMAWRQWTIEELRNGDAWDHVRQLLD